MSDGRSPVLRIISTFSNALKALGLAVPPLFVERWGVAVHQALSSRAREFHTHQHVLDLVNTSDPLETIAALYHDCVYVQVDLGVPAHFASLLEPLLAKEEKGFRILPHTSVDPVTKDVLDIFGHKGDEVLTPMTGLNEFASALVAARELEGVFTREQLLAVAACIEATIPFRDFEADHLVERLMKIGVTEGEAVAMGQRATRLSNNDVGNFGEEDPGSFLDNTWKLLPETNPTLLMPTTYSVHEYRVALMKMEKFLAGLPAERVFHEWKGEPAPEVHARRVELARRNLGLAVRYLRAKLFSTALIEALALETGGDAPIDLFMGGIPENGTPMKRFEQFLPRLKTSSVDIDPVLARLLEGGRATASSFDTSPSPVAAFLYASLGETGTMRGVEDARRWWTGGQTSIQFLESQRRDLIRALIQAATNIAETRHEALEALSRRLA